MALKLDDKKRVIEEVSEIVKGSCSVIAAENLGLTVEDMTNLRKQAREFDVKVRVVKNTLARRALKDSPFEDMAQSLVGPLVYGFSKTDLGSAARVFKNFSKENDALVVKVLSVGDGVMDSGQLDLVASLPTYDEAIGKLMYVIKAPVEQLARALNEVPGKLVRTVAAIKDVK